MINEINEGIEVGRREGKSEAIEDKKLVPIEKVMEIIDNIKDWRGFPPDIIKSKLGELAK